MHYRDPNTGQWISEAEYNRRFVDEEPEIDYPDDFEFDWDFEFDEGEYEA